MKPVIDKKELSEVVRAAARKPIGNNAALLDEFIKSGEPVVQLNTAGYSTLTSCVGSMKQSIKRHGCHHIICMSLNGKAYLVNKTKISQEEGNDE